MRHTSSSAAYKKDSIGPPKRRRRKTVSMVGWISRNSLTSSVVLEADTAEATSNGLSPAYAADTAVASHAKMNSTVRAGNGRAGGFPSLHVARLLAAVASLKK